MNVSRRAALLGTAALVAAPHPGHAQAKPTIAVRIDRDVEVLDPAFRSGLQDGNIIRAIYQRLYTVAPKLRRDGAGRRLGPEAGLSRPSVEFTLKPGQTFTDGFGEMTAEDVKFSFERFAVSTRQRQGKSPYKGDWASLKAGRGHRPSTPAAS